MNINVKLCLGYVTKLPILFGEYVALVHSVSIKEACRRRVHLGAGTDTGIVEYWENGLSFP